MSALAGFPLVNQLSEPTMDGNPDENAQNNCVPACIAAILTYFTGKPFDGDELKDAIYGQGYTGPMDAANFVDYCAQHGVRLTQTGGEDPLSLEMAARAYVAQGRPVLLTIPSNWNAEPPPTMGSTHVVVAVKEDPGMLTCMNPWGGFWHSGSDSYWQARLRGGIWSAEVITVGVPANWRDDGTTLVASNGAPVVLGFREYILSHPWAADDVPQGPEYYPQEVCPSSPIGPGTRQDFTRSTLIYAKTQNNPQVQLAPVAADYAHQEAVLAAANAQIAALQAKLSTTSEPGYVEYKAAVEAIKAALAVA